MDLADLQLVKSAGMEWNVKVTTSSISFQTQHFQNQQRCFSLLNLRKTGATILFFVRNPLQPHPWDTSTVTTQREVVFEHNPHSNYIVQYTVIMKVIR